MGGAVSKSHLVNGKDRRVRSTNELIWSAIVETAKEHQDDYPFSAMEVLIHAGKSKYNPTITRDRGGLKNFISDYRKAFLQDLEDLVNKEIENTGKISVNFCRDFGFLIITYRALLSMDFVTDSHRNIKLMIKVVSPLILDKRLLFFSAEFYQLLATWFDEGFTRESVLTGFGRKLHNLFTSYQIVRPDMRTFLGSNSQKATSLEGSFFINKDNQED